MVLNMKDIGKKTNNMDMEKKFGRMGLSLKETTSMERSREKDNSHGQTRAPTKATFTKIIFMEEEFISGLMIGFTMGLGSATKCTDSAFSPGQMEGGTKENM